MAGYTMIYRRAFKVGDRISIDNLCGFVTETRLMVTHLRTIKNEEIVVPNSTILNSHVINYTTLAASRGLILHTTVGSGYETPWRQVEAMLRLAGRYRIRIDLHETSQEAALQEFYPPVRSPDSPCDRVRRHARARTIFGPSRKFASIR